VKRRWLLAWLGGPVIGIANGTLRELVYRKRVGESAAHQISTVTALGLFTGYFRLLQRRWPIPTAREAAQIGAAWLAATIAFEFGFGHYVAGSSWSDLAADYNVARGRTWILVLLWMAVGPAATRAQRPAQVDRPSATS
jgi:hypothetical protein